MNNYILIGLTTIIIIAAGISVVVRKKQGYTGMNLFRRFPQKQPDNLDDELND